MEEPWAPEHLILQNEFQTHLLPNSFVHSYNTSMQDKCKEIFTSFSRAQNI